LKGASNEEVIVMSSMMSNEEVVDYVDDLDHPLAYARKNLVPQ
jgi:hypothetical protein